MDGKGKSTNWMGDGGWPANGESSNWGGYDGGFDGGYAGGCDGGFSGADFGGDSAQYGACSGVNYAASWGTEPAAKRQKGMPVSTGDPYKDSLVEKVKAFQRCGEEQKQAWWSFADS